MATTKTTPGVTGSIQLGTEQASTSGTCINFTSIPSGVKRITIMLDGVSTNGTNNLKMELGDSGGFELTGYIGVADRSSGTATGSTTDFILTNSVSSGNTFHGSGVLSKMSGSDHTWTLHGVLARASGTDLQYFAGTKTLSAELTQLRICAGGDTFDAGAINIQYEF